MRVLTKERIERLRFLTGRYRIMKNTVLFKSFGGQYNDNPKYISEALHCLSPSTEIVWIITEKCRDEVPSYIKKIPYGGELYYKYSTRAQVIVDNITGIRGTVKERYSGLIKAVVSSSHQLNIATWHGTPIKKIGLDTKEMKDKKVFITSADALISGCNYTYDRLTSAFYPIPVWNCGTPRNDILVDGVKESKSNDIRRKLSIPKGKKIVLFAPTFRDSIEYSGVIQIKNLDINRILKSLECKFGGNWVFVFRVHHGALLKIDTKMLAEKYSGLVINGNLHDDMAEYLAVADALITDYSGSVFDYALTGKPGFLYTPDKDYYINEERGTYISLDSLPYPHAVELDDFYRLIENYDEETAIHRITEFNQRIGNAETGHAAETIARAIIKFIETGKKENLLQ